MTQQTKTKQARRRHTTRSWFAIALTMFAALIWAKLRLVGGVPRVVYAEPDQQGTNAGPQAEDARAPAESPDRE